MPEPLAGEPAAEQIDLSVRLGRLWLPNPILVASGTFGYGREMAGLVDLSRLGGLIPKTVTRLPRAGNPPWRTVETAAGLLNSIGLDNDGIDYFCSHHLPYLRGVGCPVIVSIAGSSYDDFVYLAERLEREPGLAALELNISCPNVSGGVDFGTDPLMCHRVVAGVRGATSLPILAKLTPNVTQILPLAQAAAEGGADALTLINTLLGMAVNWRTRRPLLGNVLGGLSGPAIKPVALRCVYQVAQQLGTPILGVGGIANLDDVMQFLVTGASAVQIGTANFYDPQGTMRLLDELPAAIGSLGATRVEQIVRSLQTPLAPRLVRRVDQRHTDRKTIGMAAMRVLSGIQPTGRFHWGNYFGAIRQYLQLQEEGESYYFIANLHALTTIRDREQLRQNTLDAAIDLLALGLDPERAVMFVQSDVPEVSELCWLLMTGTPMGLLERCHAYKEKKARGLKAETGLFTYPVLMAADILAYDADVVPVGEDQVQHIEVTRDLAGSFNHQFGETFVLPKARVLDHAAKVPGTDGQKMSKSYGNTLDVFADPKLQRKQIMRITTDSRPMEEPKAPESDRLFQLYGLLAEPTARDEMAALYRRGGFGYGQVKQALADAAEKYFAAARARREEFAGNPARVQKVLTAGAERARERAAQVLSRAQRACGLKG